MTDPRTNNPHPYGSFMWYEWRIQYGSETRDPYDFLMGVTCCPEHQERDDRGLQTSYCDWLAALWSVPSDFEKDVKETLGVGEYGVAGSSSVTRETIAAH